MQTALMFFILGLVYAYGGLLITLYLDSAYNDFISNFAQDKDTRAITILIFWPVMIPVCYVLNRFRPKRGI